MRKVPTQERLRASIAADGRQQGSRATRWRSGAVRVLAYVIAPLPMLPAILINMEHAAAKGAAWTAMAIGAVIGAAVSAHIAGLYLERGQRGKAALAYAAVLVLVCYSLTNALGNASMSRDTAREAKSSEMGAAKLRSSQASQWSQARKEHAKIAGEASVATIKAELDALIAREARRWNSTEECTPEKITAGPSRELCASVASLRARVAAAEARDDLDRKISGVQAEILERGDGPQTTDSYADNIVMILNMLFGIPASDRLRDAVTAATILLSAVAVEMLGAFVPGFVLAIGARVPSERKPAAPRPAGRTVAVVVSPDTDAPAADPATEYEAHVAAFVADRLEQRAGSVMRSGEVTSLWAVFCMEKGWEPGSAAKFCQAIKKAGVVHDPNKGRPRYIGIARKITAPRAIPNISRM